MSEIETLEQSIAAMEAQRAALGDDVVNAILALARERLAVLKTARTAEKQRKQVTVVFADVDGLADVSQQLDPEDVAQLMNGYFQGWADVIKRYGGAVEKFIGDAVMAVFGLHQAREQDPEYAVRAALEMREVLENINDDLIVPRLGKRLVVRIGINTGPVLVSMAGRYKDEDFNVVGDTVNIAARLEQAAPVNGILISHDAYRHVRGLFDVREIPPLSVKGKAKPLVVYLVDLAKPRAFRQDMRGVEGMETRTVGREDELAQLQGAWRVVLRERRARAALVVGEAGVGKSRVLYELQNRMEARANIEDWEGYEEKFFRLFRGRARAELSNTPYALLRDVFMTRFQILEGDSRAAAREKLVQGVIELLPTDKHAHVKAQFIGHLLGFDFSESQEVREARSDARQIRDRAFLYIEFLFTTMAQNMPVALLLEDLHWADDDSLAWLEALLRATTKIPMLAVGLARPSLFERRQGWLTNNEIFHARIALAALSEADSRALAEEILRQVFDAPETLFKMIVSRAEGNPFYMEEIIKMLIDRKVLAPDADNAVWHVDIEHLSEVGVPTTLTGVLQARLDGLTPVERGALQRASVIGRIFWAQAVEALGQSASAPVFALLRSREFIFMRETSTFADTTEYIFKHALMRDVTYETVLITQRSEYHALAAQWLIGRAAGQSVGQAEQLAGLIAEHYEKAGQTSEALVWYGRAGDAARAAYANAAAQTYYMLQLPLLKDSHSVVETLLKLGAVHELSGQWIEAERCYQAALSTAPPDSDTVVRCQKALGVLAGRLGHYGTALNWLDRARVGWKVARDYEALGHVLTEMGVVCWQMGDFAQARRYSKKGLAVASKLGDQHGMALAFSNLANIAKNQGLAEEAREMYEKAIALQRALGNKQGLSALLSSWGNLASAQGDWQRSQRLIEESLALNREIGNKWGIALSLNNLGNMHWDKGEHAKAQALYEESLALRQALGDKRGVVSSHFNLGFIIAEQGDYQTGQTFLKMSLKQAHEIGDKLHIVYNLATLASVALGTGAPHRAARLAAVAQTLTTTINVAMAFFLKQQFARTLAAARAALDAEDFAAAWEQGARLTLEEAIGYALQEVG